MSHSPTFNSPSSLYSAFDQLVVAMRQQSPRGLDNIRRSRTVLQFSVTHPTAVIVIDGKQKPVQVRYGEPVRKPGLNVVLSAETLHRILTHEQSLRAALASGLVQYKGSKLRAIALRTLFEEGRRVYPALLASGVLFE